MGGLNCAIVIDCGEDFARQKAGSETGQIDSYKENTLPVLGHLDDFQRLEYVSTSYIVFYLGLVSNANLKCKSSYMQLILIFYRSHDLNVS